MYFTTSTLHKHMYMCMYMVYSCSIYIVYSMRTKLIYYLFFSPTEKGCEEEDEGSSCPLPLSPASPLPPLHPSPSNHSPPSCCHGNTPTSERSRSVWGQATQEEQGRPRRKKDATEKSSFPHLPSYDQREGPRRWQQNNDTREPKDPRPSQKETIIFYYTKRIF